MSLNRYTNSETIIQLNEPQYGMVYSEDDLKLLAPVYIIPNGEDFISEYVPQIHIYSFYGDYISGDHLASYITHDKATNSVLVDLADVFRSANIIRGSYIITVNLFKIVWGDPNAHRVIIREISPDRTEIMLSVLDESYLSELAHLKNVYTKMLADDSISGLVIDFGANKIAHISGLKFDKKIPGVIYIKLRKPAVDTISDLDTGWFGYEVIDTYVDTVLLTSPQTNPSVTVVPGPNFELDTSQFISNSTVFKSWDDLLDSDIDTSQRIIDLSISGSGTARLNIDYTDFSNHIFYSSATERIDNFMYKVSKLDEYSGSISLLLSSTASNSLYTSQSISAIRRRHDKLTTSLDHFERWLYYEGTSSLFTHDVSGSISPYPKYIVNGRYATHHNTSSIAQSWYTTTYQTAEEYDQSNHHRLYWSIPEHILMDTGNSNYILFVEMIANHFDNLHAYVKALTKTHERDEHNSRGPSNDILYHVAKSFGWNVQNTRQLSDLWFYKIGTSNTGQYASTGSMFSLSHENQTQQIWRRIVNNLPYLLKTKGTVRSVKAMMSIYGIPQTIISIKEYGGPSEESDKPQLIEDRYAYALKFNGGQHVSFNRRRLGQSTGSWTPAVDKYVPDTIEFRFSTDYSASLTQTIWSVDTGSRSSAQIRIIHANALTGGAKYSGSYTYGRVELIVEGGTTGSYQYFSGSTSYIPIYDEDWWTVRLYTPNPITENTATASFVLDVARSDDYTFGTYVLSGSAQVTAYSSMSGSNFPGWGVLPSSVSKPYTVRLGGTPATASGIHAAVSTSSYFSGSMHAYKEYFNTYSYDTFKEHVLNPAAYHIDEPTASFYDMYRYFPLGADVIRHDHTVSSSVSSSHPNRNIVYDTVANFNGFAGGQEDQYVSVNETYYVYTPSIGPSNVRNNKIRIEGSKLIRDLSPYAHSDRSEFDMDSFDSNRLAIVFSLADQVNRDIYNQFGFSELDDWIASPQFEFDDAYNELKLFSNEYWKKYTADNDINAFIRILSVYDYTFFEQIRQLVPGRADLIAGILIEPNILERSKVRITPRAKVTNPQWAKDITYNIDTCGELISNAGYISASMNYEICYSYLTASMNAEQAFNICHTYLTASIHDQFIFTGSSVHHLDSTHQRTGICGVVDTIEKRYSGSACPTGSYIPTAREREGCTYRRVVYHYGCTAVSMSRYMKSWHSAVSRSYHMYCSRSLEPTSYQVDECSTRNRSRFAGSKISSPWFNIDSSDTVDGGPVVVIRKVNPNSLFVGDDSIYVQ